jgi:hypothetical protein
MDLALLRIIQSNPYSFTHRADPDPALFAAQCLPRSITRFSTWNGGADIVLVFIRDDGIWNLEFEPSGLVFGMSPSDACVDFC